MTAAAIREARYIVGWSAHQAAARSGWAESTIRLWERGVHPPHPEYARWIKACASALASVPRPTRQLVSDSEPDCI